MTHGARAAELSDLHMIVLGRIAHAASADVEDIARWLGVPVVVAEAVCADLEGAGLLTAARGHSRAAAQVRRQD
jgi:DNA-binding IscR family transcriptional regulator